MTVFLTLFTNLIPLYILIALGWIAGRFCNVERESLANLVILIMQPIVIFGFIANLDFKIEYTLLPVFSFAVSSMIAFLFYALGRKIFADNRANLLGMSASMSNSGYFGLPLVILLFEPQWIGVYMFMMLGLSIFEATIAYYIAARGSFTIRDSLIKLAKFPGLYAIALALIWNSAGLETSQMFDTYWEYTKGGYVVMGMMIIGVALSKVDNLVFGPRFLSLAFAGKFVLWPIITGLIIMMDKMILGVFAPEIHRLMLVLAIVPPAANIAAFAAQLNVQPEKAATTVLIGTIFALFYIPLIIVLTGFAQ